jgi:hypothetical protein
MLTEIPSKFQIIKGIPMPAPRASSPGLTRGLTDALSKMEIGDCIKAAEYSKKTLSTFNGVLVGYKRRYGGQFTTRKIDGHLWIWRIA